jgi:hypothetical protein
VPRISVISTFTRTKPANRNPICQHEHLIHITMCLIVSAES